MTTIYITRHGQTYWNVEKRLQGQGNSDLTEQGAQGAQMLGERLTDTYLDCVVSSPLKRTVDTSEIIIGDRNIPIYTEDGLMEMHIGDFEGMTYKEAEKTNPELVKKIEDDPFTNNYPNGENLKEFYDRCGEAFDKISKQYKGKTILIVAHGGVLKALDHYVINEMVPKNWFEDVPPNCCLTKYEIDENGLKVMFKHDIKHFDGSKVVV